MGSCRKAAPCFVLTEEQKVFRIKENSTIKRGQNEN